MIEKITNQNQIARHKLAEKINELIEAVNGILDYAPLEMAMKTEPKPAENVQDENPRCPLCGEELFYVQEIDGGFDILTCNCSAGFWLFGNDKMWYNLEKTITELERTRKALDVAVDALKDNLSQANFREMLDASRFHCIKTKCESALEQITALEQKDK